MRLRVEAPDRRKTPRGTDDGWPRREDAVARILAMYAEMPGSRLNAEEAGRLCGFPATTCRVVLDDLVEAGELRRDDAGRYLGR